MSLKVLLFGHSANIQTFLEKVAPPRSSAAPTDFAVAVDNITIGETPFVVFTIKDRSLVAEQSAGTNALIFLLDDEVALHEEKRFLFDLISQKPEFDMIPLIVAFEHQQNMMIKEVINYFELYKVKDRASMIKEINFAEDQSLMEVFKWVETQSGRHSKPFDAQPKVVKMKAKYRESQEEESVKKYEVILKDKDVKALPVKAQEEVYIEREKERIKNENMEKQLVNFNKNKKKMAPYDIKTTPNPKIEANLHFFLKDPKNEKQPEVNIKIQTDEFKPRAFEKPYVPKKTGINISTQIEQNELFDFKKEVRPILNILVTKALETASLQIEEEEEFAKISKYKSLYSDRLQKRREHQKHNIDLELSLIAKKDNLLEEFRVKNDRKKRIKHRMVCYELAGEFLQGMYKKSCVTLFSRHAYPDGLQNFIHTEYLDEIFTKAIECHHKIIAKESAVDSLFDRDCLQPVLRKADAAKKERALQKAIEEKRATNRGEKERSVHISYTHHSPLFSSFTKYIGKGMSNLEEVVRKKEEQYQEITDKITSGDYTQGELERFKQRENEQFSRSHMSYLISNEEELCFTISSNRYSKGDQLLLHGLVTFGKDQEILEVIYPAGDMEQSFLRHERNLRKARQVANMDEGIALHLRKVPQKVKSIMLFVKVLGAQSYRQDSSRIRFATYGIELFERNVPIHRRNVGEQLKWDELIRAPVEGEEGNGGAQDVMVISYLLSQKSNDVWLLEDVFYPLPPMAAKEDQTTQLEEISRFYQRSHELLKEEEQEEERPTSKDKKSTSRSGQRGKSKKVIEEVKKKVALKVNSKLFPQLLVSLNSPFQEVFNSLREIVTEWKEFVDSCEHGWELLIKGSKLTTVTQLAQFSKVGHLQLVRVPKPEEPKESVEVEEAPKEEEEG